MDIINLVTSVQEGLFLHEKKLPYEVIVWEKMPTELPSGYTHMELKDLSYDFGMSGKLTVLTEKHKSVLFIIESIEGFYLLPWLSKLPKDHTVTVVQINAGISSYMSRSMPDQMDISLMLPFVSVKEVYDMDSLMHLLGQKGHSILRISFGETHASLFKDAKADGGIIDLRSHGFDGGAGTVIAPGGVLVQTIHALQHMQEQGITYDLFALEEYDFTIGKALKESIIRSEHVIVLLDQQRRTQYESIVKAKLWDSGLVDTNISFVYPNTDKINTILPEYLWEQANRDGQGIAEKLTSLQG